MRLISTREEQIHEGYVNLLRTQIADLRAENAELHRAILTLRISGAAVPVAPVKRTSDRVLEVIADVAGSNAPLRAMLGRYARQQRAAKVEDEQIIQTLMHWPDADDDDSRTDDMTL